VRNYVVSNPIQNYIRDQERQLYKEKVEERKQRKKIENARINPVTDLLEYEHEDNPDALHYKNLLRHYERDQERHTNTATNWIGGDRMRYLMTTLEKNSQEAQTPLLQPDASKSHIYRKAHLMGTTFDKTKRIKYTLSEAITLYADTVVRKGVMHADKSLKYTYMVTALADVVLSNRRIIDDLSNHFLDLMNKGAQPDIIVKSLNDKLKQLQIANELFNYNYNEQSFKPEHISQALTNIMTSEEEQGRKLNELAREIQTTIINTKQRIEKLLLSYLDEEPIIEYEDDEFSKNIEQQQEEQEEEEEKDFEYPNSVLYDDHLDDDDDEFLTEEEEEEESDKMTSDQKPQQVSEEEEEEEEEEDYMTEEEQEEDIPIEIVDMFPSEKLSPEEKLEQIMGKALFKLETNNPLKELRAWNEAFENMIAKTVRLMYRHHIYIYDMETCKKLLYICRDSRSTEDLNHQTLFSEMLYIARYSERDNRILHQPYISKQGAALNEATRHQAGNKTQVTQKERRFVWKHQF
jgi:hypothetical protein